MKKNNCFLWEWEIPGLQKLLRVMKLTTFLLLISVISVFANKTYSQTKVLNLKMKNSTVKEVLQNIEKQSEFYFMYSEKLVDVNREVSVDIRNQKISEVLDELFSGTDVNYKVKDRFILLITPEVNGNDLILQQQNSISGTVTDDSGQPLPGVTVIIKGTTQGTVTNTEGKYSLSSIPDNATLIFSFVGMQTQEVVVGEQSSINITMQLDAIGLEEVMAIGYGTQKKINLTGAVAAVKGDDLIKAPVPNLSAALTGKLSGVVAIQESGQPGYDGANLQIRGLSTTGNNAPLVIVDGVERPFSRMDPFEIESVTVLKDAASTAVYGARAANGILLITTKRGKLGKPVFSYTGSYGVQSQIKKIELMNAAEYATYYNEARVNYGGVPLYTDAEIAKYESGELPSYSPLETLFSPSAPQQKQSISVSGGTGNTKYFLSYGYLDQEGLFASAKYKQHNIRSNIDVDLSENLSLGLDISGRIENRSGQPGGQNSSYQGTLMVLPIYKPFLDEEIGPGALGQSAMPLANATRSGSLVDKVYVFQSNVNLKYNIPGIKGLFAKAFYSFDFSSGSEKLFRHPYTIYQLNDISGEYSEIQGGPTSINLSEERRFYQQSTMQFSLNYSTTIEDHAISALALFEQVESSGNTIQAFRDGFMSTALPELFAGGTSLWSNDGTAYETARRGYIGRVDYNYQGKYLLQANMRLDQSFNFPAEGRNGFFPAFSAGWRVSEESFMENIGALSNLKLRGSWGMVGNDRVSAYQYLSSFAFDGGTVIGGNYLSGISSTGLANPNITWETATSWNIGVDFGLFNNKISGEFEYFSKRTEDILRPNSGIVPSTFGAALPDENIGIVDSWGSEGAIRYNNTFGELGFAVSANYTWSENKIVDIAEPEDILPAIAQTGREIGILFGYLSDGLFQTQSEIDAAPVQWSEAIHNELKPGDIKYKDINGRDASGNFTGKPDGKIDDADRTVVGESGIPNLVFGLGIELDYKGFDLFANFQGATGFTRLWHPIPFERDGNTYAELADSWRPGNEDAKYPRLSFGDLPANHDHDRVSDFWATDVTYLKLRNIELGYSFKNLNKVGIDNVRLFFSGSNLLSFSNLDWRDPEAGVDLDNTSSSRNPFYPQVKTLTFGVNVKF
ncbi:MAG: TonB-dependent receptor [Bacteroidota bacterium]